MAEFIDKDAAIKAVNEITGAAAKIAEVPAADVRPVVTCKECAHNEDKGKQQFYQWCSRSNKYRAPDWFCFDGIREEEDE